MNKLMVISFAAGVLFTSVCAAKSQGTQFVEGRWQGSLSITAEKSMDMLFHFKKAESGFKATLDVPIQQQFGLEFNKVIVNGDQIELAMDVANMKYSATFSDNEITGTYSQGAFKAPLILVPAIKTAVRQKKIQENFDNLPYSVEKVQFSSLTGEHQLSGTLSYPAGDIRSVAILLSGSGPTTRDADVFGHKVFAVLADQLTRQNIAVLRYDDRGVGESTGDFSSATSKDFANDANAAYQFIANNSKFKSSNIGFIGHSEGGLIGAIAAAENPSVDFFVSLAGPGTSGAQILIDQSFHIQQLRGMDKESLEKDDRLQKEVVRAIVDGISEEMLIKLLVNQAVPAAQAKAQAKQMTSPWFEFFIKEDPKKYLSQLHIPVLALNGELDAQVLAEQNITGIKQAVNSSKLTTTIYSGLNHLFQPAVTGLPKEYSQIDITFSEQVSIDISRWIKSLG
jgi:pimeloyl-ACP methyl ester carboxylesterase